MQYHPQIRTLGIVFFLSCASCTLLPIHSAFANIAAASRTPAGLSQSAPLQPTPLEVRSEELAIQCPSGPRTEAPKCTFEATYTVHNPTHHQETLVGLFFGVRLHDTHVSIDGTPSQETALPDELRALHARFLALDDEAPNRKDTHASVQNTHSGVADISVQTQYTHIKRRSFVLRTDPQATHTVRVRGTLHTRARSSPSFIVPAPNVRHPLLPYTPDSTYDLDYLLSPIRTWAAVGPITVRITTPDSWTHTAQARFVSSRLLAYWESRDTPLTVERSEALRARGSAPQILDLQTTPHPSTQTHTSTLTLHPKDRLPDVLSLHFTRPAPPIDHGGPLLAVGGPLTGRTGVRLRAGHEVHAGDTFFFGLHYDTNIESIHSLALTSTVASPMILFLPSMALTLGIPVQITPDTTVGARVQGELQFPLLGLIASLDIYPDHTNLPDTPLLEALLMAQVGF